MPQPRIAVYLPSLKLPFRPALAAAGRMGAQAVELDARRDVPPAEMTATATRQIRKWLEDANLRLAALHFPTRRGYAVLDELEARVDATKRVMKLARELGCGLVVTHLGRLPEKELPAWSLLCEVLTDLGRYGQHVGSLLAAETGSESGVELARLLAALPEGSLGITLNPGNLIMNGYSPLEAIEALGPHVVHVHAADAVHDPHARRGMEVALGRGSADFPALLGALEEHDYRGYLTVIRYNSEDPQRELALAVQYLKSL
jgi:sugar phosphate isomerase/epimerase